MKYALRQLAKNPGFTSVALLTLALGIGASTTAFSVLSRFLLQSLPFREPAGLVQIWGTAPRDDRQGISPGDYYDLIEGCTAFEAVGAYAPYASVSLAEPGVPAVHCKNIVSTANMFQILGIQPELGRTFSGDEESHLANVTMVGNAFWHEHFGGDPHILGRSVRLDGKAFTIVGVLPRSLDDPTVFEGQPAFWSLDPTKVNFSLRAMNWYSVAARLKPGTSLAQAQAQVSVIGARLAKDFPKTNKDRGFRVAPYPINNTDDTAAEMTWLTLALSLMVLLIACVNIANLQLVRTTRRGPEIAIRLALGSSRSRILGMLLLESFIVSIVGGVLALAVAKWSNLYVAGFLGIDMPLDMRVVVFDLAVALATGALFGTVPAWIASRSDVNDALKSGGRGGTRGGAGHWLRQGLVVVELALALVVLSGASFFVTGIYRLTHRSMGWNGDHIVSAHITLDHDHFGELGDPRTAVFSGRVEEALRAIPGVVDVSVGGSSPAWGFRPELYRVEGATAPNAGQEDRAGSSIVGPGYLKMYDIPLLKGRDFTTKDRQGSPRVVIVNEAMAKLCWPGEDPIGKRLGEVDPSNPDWATVVGVMKDFQTFWEFSAPPGARARKFLVPWAQNTNRFITIHVRTEGSPNTLVDSVRKAISGVAPDYALDNLAPLTEMIHGNLSYYLFLRSTLLQLSVLGLLLAAVGIYGVVATLAYERTREIGIRMALGAQAKDVVWLFLKSGVRLAMIGAIVGVVASFYLLRLLMNLLSNVPGYDPRIVVGVGFFLFFVAIIACWIPARRTTRVDPSIALRAE
jgi:putative ABC transport system permease protein